jgi:hypothetical protein
MEISLCSLDHARRARPGRERLFQKTVSSPDVAARSRVLACLLPPAPHRGF